MTEEEETKQQTAPSEEAPPVQEDNWKDKYFRTLAEMENMRKRIQKEKQDVLSFGIENAISEFLPAIDTLENALRFADSASGEVKSWAEGFKMILSQFKEVLHNHGIVAFHSEGNLFDPHFHEAMEIIETDEVPDGIIMQELAKGYKSESRTIRAARVKVARAAKTEKIEIPQSVAADEESE